MIRQVTSKLDLIKDLLYIITMNLYVFTEIARKLYECIPISERHSCELCFQSPDFTRQVTPSDGPVTSHTLINWFENRGGANSQVVALINEHNASMSHKIAKRFSIGVNCGHMKHNSRSSREQNIRYRHPTIHIVYNELISSSSRIFYNDIYYDLPYDPELLETIKILLCENQDNIWCRQDETSTDNKHERIDNRSFVEYWMTDASDRLEQHKLLGWNETKKLLGI